MTMGFFITGTDTGIGKTTATLLLMKAVNRAGYSVAAMKPVASGCEKTPKGLCNHDALQLIEASTVTLPYKLVNPYAFEPAIAPHLAAKAAGAAIEIDLIVRCYQEISKQVDIVFVEGVGGWTVPVDESRTMVDVAAALALPVVLVVGIRLGCLNHALLSDESIGHGQCSLRGWVANCIERDMPFGGDNITYLENHLRQPLLGNIPYIKSPATDLVESSIDLTALLDRR